jgi:hypothetical protein
LSSARSSRTTAAQRAQVYAFYARSRASGPRNEVVVAESSGQPRPCSELHLPDVDEYDVRAAIVPIPGHADQRSGTMATAISGLAAIAVLTDHYAGYSQKKRSGTSVLRNSLFPSPYNTTVVSHRTPSQPDLGPEYLDLRHCCAEIHRVERSLSDPSAAVRNTRVHLRDVARSAIC